MDNYNVNQSLTSLLSFLYDDGDEKILTAAVPVILAPGEDAFNEMKAKDGDFSKNAKLKSSGKGGRK
jgi:hypothetical protein